MPHFFIQSEQVENDKIKISKGETFTHLKSALRVNIGEKVLFIDEKYIQYETVVELIEKDFLIASVQNKYPSKRFIKHNLYLAQSVLKTDAQFYAIQKASELGVKAIYPLITDNCAVKQKVAEQKIPHWQKISYEASKQCERPDVAQIMPLNNFDFVLNNKEFEHILFFTERNSNTTLKELAAKKEIKPTDKILVVIGPEGGFSENEFAKMEKYAVNKLSLGNLILRADTAVTAALATVLYELGY